MSRASGLKTLWLSWFSRPVGNRTLYRFVRKRRPLKIMEMGIGDGARAVQLVSLAQRYHRPEDVCYVGIDRFETRPVDQRHLSLKDAHRLLRTTGARINLIPGDAYQALMRSANALREIDLVLISADQDPETLTPAWFYLPRTLAPTAVLLREELVEGEPVFQQFSRRDVEAWAAAGGRRRAA